MSVPVNKMGTKPKLPGAETMPEKPADGVEFLSAEQQAEMEERIKMEREEMARRADALAAGLVMLAKMEHGNRQMVEQRWLDDLRQYEGQYDEETLKNIEANKGSKIFVNITRPKTKTARARLSDMLFPNGDRNWDIQPTPVPELMAHKDDDTPLRNEQGDVLRMPPGPDGEPGRALTVADRIATMMRKASDTAKLMVAEIDDQLTEARYEMQSREVIHDGCLLGTGIIKGPIVIGRTRRKWEKRGSVRVLTYTTDERPSVKRVDPWNFFPDSAAANMQECRHVLERSFLTEKQLMGLAKDQYYIGGNILRAMAAGAQASQITNNPTIDKRNNQIQGAQSVDSKLFEVWEYHGPIDKQDLRAVGVDLDDDIPDGLVSGCVVFVGSVVIKAYINPMETGDLPYSVFNYVKDEASIFGYGVPYMLRNEQRMLNAAVRAMLDNAGVSAGPQIIINKKCVQPADGDYTLRRNKVWELVDSNKSVKDVMATFNIDSRQNELQAIVNMAQKFSDEVSSLPLIAQGEQGTATKTFQGIALLNNNANIVTRDTVKLWDDGVTMTLIVRLYDWNMQNSPREEIKGDFEVDARGSSVLLSKELQAQNLMTLGANFVGSPVFGGMMRDIEVLRKIVQAMHVRSEDVVKTDAEYEEWQKKQQGSEPPEVMAERQRQEFEAKQAENEMKYRNELEDKRHKNRMAELQLENEDNMVRYAMQQRMGVDKLKAMLAGKQIEGQNKRRAILDEAAVKAKFGTGV